MDKSNGADVLNDAIDQLSANIQKSEFQFVNVAVTHSKITISEHGVCNSEIKYIYLCINNST